MVAEPRTGDHFVTRWLVELPGQSETFVVTKVLGLVELRCRHEEATNTGLARLVQDPATILGRDLLEVCVRVDPDRRAVHRAT